MTILRESKSLSLDTDYYSIPEEISWPTTEGHTAHGYYYPPANKDFNAPGEVSFNMLVLWWPYSKIVHS